uniref:GDP-fucose protein O-fucosyltransferase 2 n=1 Tax=Fagus sylvatica TaxID=28930 RepID=A0A2N9FZU2_FAGSY
MERDTLSSSDEDDDHQNLIEQNDTKHHYSPPTQTPPPPTFSSLHIINDFNSGLIRRRFHHLNKKYLFAILLPLLILILYFSTDLRHIFSSNSNFQFDSLSFRDRMRESELRALYLLKQQRLGLLTLWNHSNSNSTSQSDLLLNQISLNKQIQQVLLSPHRSGNSSETDFSDPRFGGFDATCAKVERKTNERRTIEWKPKSDKYLFAVCLSGQMSNHLICLEKHMFFAALLNRVLVIPSSKFDYQYDRVLDIDHINKCLGRKVIVSFEELLEAKKNHLHIDRFLCYFSQPQPCYLDDEHVKRLKSLGVSMGKLESVWVEDIKNPKKRTVQDVQSKFSSNEDVIAIGDVFYADLERDWVMQPSGPIAHQCKTLIEPSRLIMLTAQRFVQTFLGKNFVALHFRRHGFLKFCNVKTPSCFFPIPQAADCITRMVEKANSPVIYLSTDAAESETSLLQSLVVLNGKPVPLVKRPPRNSAEKWDALLYRHGLEDDSQVEAMLDKTICAMSSVFIGAPGSTFTEDILRLRKDWGSASMCDEYLCQGEEPNFIADNE